MKPKYQPKKRHKKSKFDPYIDEISKCVEAGMSVRKIAETIECHFEDIVSEDALYAFMRARGLQSRVTQGGTNINYDIPHCEGCSNCLTVINTNESEVFLCLPSRRIISRSCKTSPIWCEKRKKAERVS